MQIKEGNIENEIKSGTFNFLETFGDLGTLEKINEGILQLLFEMRKVSKELDEVEARRIKAEFALDVKYRREYFEVKSASNETQRKLIAEMACEKEEKEKIRYEELAKRKNRRINSIKIEIDSLKTIGYNMRQELKSLG